MLKLQLFKTTTLLVMYIIIYSNVLDMVLSKDEISYTKYFSLVQCNWDLMLFIKVPKVRSELGLRFTYISLATWCHFLIFNNF